MEKTEGISRARFLGGAVAAGAAAALGPAGDARTAQGRRGLRHRGVVYAVGRARPRRPPGTPTGCAPTSGPSAATWQAFHALARHYAAAARGHRRPATDSRT
ncbi:hypothetical protein U5640_01710 [Streptomyces sp. SS7]|uniref:hypothetical protein n=1 Tax=Streptomyces sp. SS7 TaxID=3108485 RepID=UPI0030EC67D2